MQIRYIQLLVIIALMGVIAGSCRKGQPVHAPKVFGELQAELLGLPGTPTLDVYFNDRLVDSLLPGRAVGMQALVEAEKPVTISFKRKHAQEVLLDTVMTIGFEQRAFLKLAYSEELGMKGFLSGRDSLSRDSVLALFYYDITSLHPDGVEIIAEMEAEDPDLPNSFLPFDIMGQVTKKQMLGKSYMLSVNRTDGNPRTYRIRLKNSQTGEYLKDNANKEFFNIRFDSHLFFGKTVIVTLAQKVNRGKQTFVADPVVL